MSDSTRDQLMDLLEALDGGDYADIADAILAALHPEVATVDELDALPDRSVVLVGAIAFQRDGKHWRSGDDNELLSSLTTFWQAPGEDRRIVLHRPDAKETQR